MTMYDSRINNRSSHNKISCVFDEVLLIVKTLITIMFTFFNKELNVWVYITIICFFSILLVFLYSTTRPFLNELISLFYYFSMGLLTWASVVLLISQILKNTNFNGGIILFFIGIPFTLAFITALSNSFSQLNVLLTQIINLRKGEQALIQIRLFLYLYNLKDKSRKWKILLKGYAYQYETSCLIVGCPLKKYLLSLERKAEINVFLLQHAEILFKRAISKFPANISLRLGYCFFLLEYLNLRQQASQELNKAENHGPSFSENFIIYRFKRLTEEQITDLIDSDDFHEAIISNTYNNYFTSFKQSINKVTSHYISFWNILLSSSQNQDQLNQLNACGSQIQEQTKEIKSLFEKMQNIRPNDQEILYYYFDYHNNILNDKEKAKYYQSKLNQAEETKKTVDEINIFNKDDKFLSSTDEYQYIILSGRRENFGIITHVSTSICSLLGYYKEELIGKAYEILLPEIFHKTHRKILNDKVNTFKKEMTDLLNDSVYNPTQKEISTFARNKARYLVPIRFNVDLISSESNGISFIAKLNKGGLLTTNYYNTACYIITNNMLIIQNFSANAVNLLKMNSNVMSKTIDITIFIKQFQEDYLNIVSDKTEVTHEMKLGIKRQIINNKFRSPMLINWKLVDSVDLRFKSSKFLDSQLSSSVDYTKMNKNISSETLLTLSVSDAMIGGKQEGYIFKFSAKGALNSTNISLLTQSHYNSNIDISPFNRPNTYQNLSNTRNNRKSNQELNNDFLLDQYKTKLPEGNAVFNIDTNKMSYVANTNDTGQIREEIRNKAIQIIQQNSFEDTMEKSENNRSSETYSSDFESESDDGDEDDEEYSIKAKKKSLQIDTNILKKKSPFQENNILRIDTPRYTIKIDTPRQNMKIDTPRQNIDTPRSGKNVLKIDTPRNRNMLKIDTPSNGNILKIDTPNTPKMSRISSRSMKQLEIKQSTEEYYKVLMTNIKYLVYSYKKKVLIEMPNYPKKSQVVIKMYDNEYEEKMFKSKKSMAEKEKVPEDEYSEVIDKEGILIKQIDQVLTKEEKQSSIVRLKWMTFIIFSFSIIFDLSWAIMTIIGNTQLNDDFILINDSSELIINSLLIHANIRDLTLLSHDNYSNIIESSVEIEKEMCLTEILELFHKSHELNLQIITSPLKNLENQDFFNTNTYKISSIRDNLSVVNYNMTLSSAFVEINTAAFHITKDLTDFYPTNKYIFFYLNNLNNEVYTGLKAQETVFLKEFQVYIKALRLYFIIMMSIGYSVLICFYFGFERLYDAVVKKKESYLAAFLEIRGESIQTLLKKCEQFSKKLQFDSFSEFLTTEDFEYEEKELATCPIRRKRSNIKIVNNSKETILIKVSFAVFIGLTFLISGLHFLCYCLFLNELSVYTEILNSQNEVILEHLIVYRNIREYVFDETNIVDSSIIGDAFPEYILNFFSGLYLKTVKYLNYRERFPASYDALYTKLYHTELCDTLNITLPNCTTFLDHSSQYGLTILLSVFIEEIREMKNREKYTTNQSNQKGYKYNLTLNGLDQYFDYYPNPIPDDYYALSPINTFNENTYWKIKYIYQYFLKPSVRMILKELSTCFKNFIYFFSIMLLMSNLLYFILTSGAYLIVWKPYENKMNKLVYQTKNMLSILPKETLLTISNIVTLLDINQKFHPKKINEK